MNLLFRRIPRNFSAVRSKDLFDDLCADQIVSEPFVLEFILSPSSLGMSQNESYDLFKEANMACNMDDVFFCEHFMPSNPTIKALGHSSPAWA